MLNANRREWNEAAELLTLARSLSTRAETHQPALSDLAREMAATFDGIGDPIELERAAEEFARRLRRLWLEASASCTGRFYRSPPTTEATRTAMGATIDFGYERDLRPAPLEERCKAFFDRVPSGWTADHVLLSSGQSAMAAVLHALEGGWLSGRDRKLPFAHLGSYFETGEIITLFSSLLRPLGRGRKAVDAIDELDADIFLVEPVFCDGEYGIVDLDRLVDAHGGWRRRSRVYLFDNTLTGTSFVLERQLHRFQALDPFAVFRLFSGLKLFQAGLELASVGVLSIFTPEGGLISARQLGDRVRRIRTLLGLGLSFSEVTALEAPWFLNREHTHHYQSAIFKSNERLACAVSAENRLFRGVFHPSLLGGTAHAAPFCAFRLRESDSDAYAVLEQHIGREVERRGMLLEHGGSFGFRGHRFEVVRPEDGTEPFLRVALGRRGGASCDQAIELISDVGRASDLSQLVK